MVYDPFSGANAEYVPKLHTRTDKITTSELIF